MVQHPLILQEELMKLNKEKNPHMWIKLGPQVQAVSGILNEVAFGAA